MREKTYWPLIVGAYGALLAMGFVDNLRGPYFPAILDEFSLSDTKGAWFFATASLLAFVSSWFTKNLVEHQGSVRSLRIGLFLLGLSCFFISKSWDFTSLILSSAVFGLGFGIVSVAQNMAVAEGASKHSRRQLLSGLHAFYGLASVFAPLAVTLMEYFSLDWRKVFFTGGFLPLLGCLLNLKVSSNIKARAPKESVVEKLHGKRKGLALWLGFATAVYLFGELSLSTRLVLYLIRNFEWSLAEASFYLTQFFVGLFLSRFVFFVMKPRISSLKVIYTSLLLSILCICSGLLLHPFFLCLSAVTMGPFVPAAIDYLVEVFHESRAEVVSYTMAFFSLVVVSMHFLLGAITDAWGIHEALWLGPVGLIASLGLFAGSRFVFHINVTNFKSRIC